MSKKREKLKVEPRFVHSGHGVGLSVTPQNGTNEAHGAHYVLPAGVRLASPNGGPTSQMIEVNGKKFKISFQAAKGKVESLGPDEDGRARLFFSTASLEDLEIADLTDPSSPQVRLEAKRLAAGALSKSFPPKPGHGNSQARPGKDGEEDPSNRIDGLKLDGVPVRVEVDRKPLHLFPTLKGLRDNFKGEFKKKYGHRFLRNGGSLPRDKVFATLVDLMDRNGSKNGFHQDVCANPRAGSRNNVIYLDGFGRLELGLAWRSAHALRIQMLRIVLDPTVQVKDHKVEDEGMFPLRAPFSHAGVQPSGQQNQLNADAQLSPALGLAAESDAKDGLQPELPQAELYCADVESCGGNYPPSSR